MHTPPDTCELPDQDGERCGSSAQAQCSDCHRLFCWGHTGNDRDYRCTPCSRARGER